MAQIFRKEPAATETRERPKNRAAAAPQSAGRPGLVSRLLRYFDEIGAELRKVTWPSREETRNLTLVVIGISVTLGAFLGGIDLVLSQLYRLATGQ